MALPKTVESLDLIPEIARDHYAEREGVWTLTLLSSEEHSGLVSALKQERTLRQDADKQLGELKARYDGIDPEEVAKLRDRVKTFEDVDIYDKHGIDALVAKRTETMKAENERVLAAKEREIGHFKDQAQSFEQRWRSDRIQNKLTDACAKAGVAPYAFSDAVERGMKVFTDLDEQGAVIARDGHDVRYGKDGINPLTPDEWYLSLKAAAPHLWPPSTGGGAPAHHGVNGQATDWNKITNPADRLTAWRQAGIAAPPKP